jgi:hypothetical protein
MVEIQYKKTFNYIINIYLKFSKHWIRLILISKIKLKSCHNPNLGLVTKARACKGVGQEGNPRVTSHAPGSVGECEESTFTLPSEFPFWELKS